MTYDRDVPQRLATDPTSIIILMKYEYLQGQAVDCCFLFVNLVPSYTPINMIWRDALRQPPRGIFIADSQLCLHHTMYVYTGCCVGVISIVQQCQCYILTPWGDVQLRPSLFPHQVTMAECKFYTNKRIYIYKNISDQNPSPQW